MFYGRRAELQKLNEYAKKKTSSLIVIKGRRRIGKSTLVEEFAKDKIFYRFSGLSPTEGTTAQSQRDEFALQLGAQIGLVGIKSDDWTTLFVLLAKHVEIQRGPVVILFDEISWMGSKDPLFLGKLKNAWDIHFKQNNKLILILCGSASSWIEKNIISSTGFLGRVSFAMTLEALSLTECTQFWGKHSARISSFEKLKLLSVTGGVPRYLEEIDPRASAEENIKRLCFTKGGMLVNEFNNLFSDLFLTKSAMYKQIVEQIADGAKEVTEIAKHSGAPITGRLTGYLNELELGGFIKQDFSWDIKGGYDTRLKKYRLSDNYLRFYLKYIGKNLSKINRGSFALRSLSTLPGWDSVLSLQFENLVLNNRNLVHQALCLEETEIIVSNPYFQRNTKTHQGCQIDYMIKTRHNVVYVCEIKFSKNPLSVSVIQEVEQKIGKLFLHRGISMRPVLIHVNGVTQDLQDQDYFSEIIDFSQFLQ